MIDTNLAMKGMKQWADGLNSEIFKGTIKPFAVKILESLRGEDNDTAVIVATKSMDRTIAELSNNQAEAIICENIFLELIKNNIDEEKATEILEKLGYTINPDPLKWLLKKIGGLRDWIIDAIAWLRKLGELFGLTIQTISVEISIAPRVVFTFGPPEKKME